MGDVTLTLRNTKLEGDLYMGGSSNDEAPSSSVESVRLILGEDTRIAGALHTGGFSAASSAGSGAPVASSTIVLESTDVVVDGGVSEDEASAAPPGLL